MVLVEYTVEFQLTRYMYVIYIMLISGPLPKNVEGEKGFPGIRFSFCVNVQYECCGQCVQSFRISCIFRHFATAPLYPLTKVT